MKHSPEAAAAVWNASPAIGDLTGRVRLLVAHIQEVVSAPGDEAGETVGLMIGDFIAEARECFDAIGVELALAKPGSVEAEALRLFLHAAPAELFWTLAQLRTGGGRLAPRGL